MGVNAELLTRHIPLSREENLWAGWRPPTYRTPVPAIGDPVLYRHEAWTTPVGATVLNIDDIEPPTVLTTRWASHLNPPYDPNVWRVRTTPGSSIPLHHPDGTVILDRLPDAWPTLLLKIDGQRSHVQTREARLRGSAGWLPLDWQDRTRPVPGRPFPDWRRQP